MRLRIIIELLAALILTFAAAAAISQMAKASGIEVENAYARASIGAATSGVVYMTVENRTSQPMRLRSAATVVASRAELHLHAMNGDILTMNKLDCLIVPAGGKLEFAPGGLHVMLLGLSAPLQEGSEFSLRLSFDAAGDVLVKVPVKSAAAGAGGMHHAGSLQSCD